MTGGGGPRGSCLAFLRGARSGIAALRLGFGRLVAMVGGNFQQRSPLVMPALVAGTYDFLLWFSRSRGWQAQGLP